MDARSGLTSEPVTIYQYDAAARLARVVDPLGYAWAYQRDAAGRVTKATGPVVSPAANATHRQPVWQSFYDPAGNLTQAIDPEGHSTSHTYWPNNSLAATTTPVTFTDDSGAPQLVNVIEQYQRDAMGRLTRVVDGNNQATAFTLDGLGRTLTTTRDAHDTTRAKIESTTYDARLPVATVDANHQCKEFLYNAQFRLEHLNVISSAGESLTYLYDLLGRVTSIAPTTSPTDLSMGDPSIARSYDVLGRLESEISNGVTTVNGYDLLNRIAKVTTYLPDSTVGRELGIRHDAIGRTARVADTTNGATLVTTFGYDLAGNQVLEGMSNGLAQASDFDPVGRVTTQRVLNATGNVLCKTDYQYDLISNVTHIEESAAALGVPSRVIDNTYNERSQLVAEIQSDANSATTRSEIHGYDSAENRISTTATTPTGTLTRLFEYGSVANGRNSNQIYQLTETPDGGASTTTTYGYDDNGNRVARAVGGVSDTYAYDTSNRLTQLTLTTSSAGDNGTYNYAYDPLTRRISRSVGVPPTSSIRLFAFSGSTPVQEWDSATNNGSLVSNIGGGIGGRLYTQDAGGLTSYPFHNARGDVIAQFTGATMTYHATYAASGILQSQAGTRTGNYGANGKWEEPGGLINDGFRYRDRLTDTFLTPDPAGFIDGPNTYNYVGHNPWSAWDPNGLYERPQSEGEIGFKSATVENGRPTITYTEWAHPWTGYIFGGSKVTHTCEATGDQLACLFQFENGKWREATDGERNAVTHDRTFHAIVEEMKQDEQVITALEVGGSIGALLPAAAAALPAVIAGASASAAAASSAVIAAGEFSTALYAGAGDAAIIAGAELEAIGGTTFSRFGYSMTLGDGLAIAGATWLLATENGNDWLTKVGSSGLSPLQNATLLGLDGIVGMASKTGEIAPTVTEGMDATASADAANSGARFGSATSMNYRATFFEANAGLEGDVVVHHAVEQQALTRFPGTVTEAEIHSLENLRGIPKEINSDVHLSQIRRSWNDFYRNNPSPTPQHLLDHATTIDEQFGHLFNPPVR